MIRHLHIAILLLLLLPQVVSGKKKSPTYTAQEIVALSDSLLRNTIGDTLFQYCSWDSSSYYIWQKGDRQHFVVITEEEKIKSQITLANIRYNFIMPYAECMAYDTVSGIVDLVLQKEDSIFSLKGAPDMSFIPKIALMHEPCNFLTNKEALQKAQEAHLKTGITPPYASLTYVPSSGHFVWIVQSLLWEEQNFDREHEPKKDIVIINAVSGVILKHTTLLYTQDILELL